MNKKVSIIVISIIIVIVAIVLGYFCLFRNDNKEKSLNLVGNWIADGTQSRTLLEIKPDGTKVYADDYSKPYKLQIKSDGTYYIDFQNKNGTETGKYTVSETGISFTPSNYPSRVLWYCSIKSDNEIAGCLYATSFLKK